MTARESPTILMAANSSWNLTHFRGPIIKGLIERGYSVAAAVPADDGNQALRDAGVQVYTVPLSATGLSPVRDLSLLFSYRALLRKLQPRAFLTFTVKPNIYGSLAARSTGVPAISTITGLGTGFLSGRAMESLIATLYRASLSTCKRVFFHNEADRDLFVERRLVRPEQAAVTAGSGVDLEHFAPVPKLRSDGRVTFLFIGRLLKDKGALEFAEAASMVGPSARFMVLGPIEEHPKALPKQVVESYAKRGVLELLGTTRDVRPFIGEADCVVLPSYREGLPRALLEASAMRVPAIATDVPGCRDVVEAGQTGFLCEARSSQSLAQAMKAFAALPAEDRAAMGRRARDKAERAFSVGQVIADYLDAVEGVKP